VATIKKIFSCNNCGAKYPKWMGQCIQCGEWNTIEEEIIKSKKIPEQKILENNSKVQEIKDISTQKNERIKIYDNELNRVLGGGLVPGSLILISGEPGIGKSTLILQISISINKKVLYVSGEESQQQIKIRADRISNDQTECYILTETNLELILKSIENILPEIIVIDSIQTIQTDNIDNSQGSTPQIKECTSTLIKVAKQTGIPIIIIGHITKDGNIAGPKVLEHMVDVVLNFEGDKNHQYRILRSKKNRFGSTSEIGIYEMFDKGLQIVKNPSELFTSNRDEALSGNSIGITIDGNRSIMVEIQALVSSAVYGTPQRISNGFNSKRLNMLLAILEKKLGFKIGIKDVFINITGGIKIEDPALDLAVVSSILSSNTNLSIDSKVCFCAEIGLSGELRNVSNINLRISEAERLGYEKIIISKGSKLNYINSKIQILKFSKLNDVVKEVFREQD
jgi:DNA repair protein RadA/Sms|tara:strand:- start:284 stop:1642 length:1359 start_codon:yes stop_codon:yes gene_type:complete